ncbi:regulator of G-protein signaling 21-like [Histomonas meleagridis]|uniref:regulator of G-protein signaling 21-like n=1 Tax=Histomonas meleagridis TaxID=135588 RepID=UPI0035593F23|nr:regulator of G-protein signaling 21-like [Histomonas meleagridis]KAH0801906.1 regulator of G-protein signaling 21-like [Histomonas meleagridis]
MPIQLAYVKPPEGNLGTETLDKLENLLKDKEASKLFLKYLQKRYCPEGYLFYREVEKFRKLTREKEINEAFEKIKRLYIEPNGPRHINIPDYMVKDIKKVSVPSATVFDNAFDENMKLMKTDVFPQFKCTKEAEEYAKRLRAKRDIVGVEASIEVVGFI